jgi:hypothetical protein
MVFEAKILEAFSLESVLRDLVDWLNEHQHYRIHSIQILDPKDDLRDNYKVVVIYEK